jgi:integrase
VQAHLPAALQPIVEFAYITGWRIASEVLPLEWRNVDFAAGEVRLDAGTTKNGEGRVFPVTDDLRALLEVRYAEHLRLTQDRPDHPVRVLPPGGGHARRRDASKTRPRVHEGVGCRVSGDRLPWPHPHDLRRTAVRNMVRRGVPERVAMKLTGHKTPSVFQRYNVVSDGDLRTAAHQLRGLTGTKRGQSGSLSPDGEDETSNIAQ